MRPGSGLGSATTGTAWPASDPVAFARARIRSASAPGSEAGVEPARSPEVGAKVSLSPEAARALDDEDAKGVGRATGERTKPDGATDESVKRRGQAQAARDRNGKAMSSSELQVLENLRARDTAVRAHEAAHQAAAGGLGGAAHFDYETGPDGKSYAVSGDVPVQIGGGRNAEERLANANRVMRAALAPADPSAQDRAVAAQAAALAIQAQQEVSTRGREKGQGAAPGGEGAAKASAKASEEPGAHDGAPTDGAPTDAASDASREDPSSRTAEGLQARETARASASVETERAGKGTFAHSHAGDGCATCGQLTRRYATAA